jgi:hypothetical protein
MKYAELALEHWPFLVAAAAFHVLGIALKNGPLSKRRAAEVRWVRRVRRWFPLPLIIITIGILVGALAPVPVPESVEQKYAWLYYLGAAVAPIVWHTVLREWRRYRGEPLPEKSAGDILADSRSTLPPD